MDDEEEGEYYFAGESDEEDGDDEQEIEEAEEFRGKTLDEKEKILAKRKEQRKEQQGALYAKLEAKARKKLEKSGYTLPSEEAFAKKGQKDCPEAKELKAVQEDLAKIEKQLAECRAKKCKTSRTRKRGKTTAEIKPVSKEASAAARKLRIQKMKDKRAARPTKVVRRSTAPRAPRKLKECKTGYTRNEASKRCEKGDSVKVAFAKELLEYDRDVKAGKGGSKKVLFKYLDRWFDKNMALVRKQRLQSKEQSEVYSAARYLYFVNNPDKAPKRKREMK